MLTNREIYNLMDKIGLTPNDDRCCVAGEDILPLEEEFVQNSDDVVYVMNFVNDLFLMNSDDKLKNFLVALIMKNGKNDA